MTLRCAGCGSRHRGSFRGERCPDCDGPLVVDVDLTLTRFSGSGRIPSEPDLPGLWRYLPLLPVSDRTHRVWVGHSVSRASR